MTSVPYRTALCFALGVGACSDSDADTNTPTEPEIRVQASLIDHFQWTEAQLPEDPFAEQRPAEVRCTPQDWFSERVESNGVIYTEVATATCNYLTLMQPSQVDLFKGDTLSVLAWHGDLVSMDRAEGVMALVIGQTIVWEERHNIPGFQQIYNTTFVSTVDAPAGTPIYFHVRNHGVNSWNLLDFNVGDP